MHVVELAAELEAKIEKLLPGSIVRRPPATAKELRTAEVLHGVDLTPEVVALAELHNGCIGWPYWHIQQPLVGSVADLALFPNVFRCSGGPFEERKAVVFASYPGEQNLVTPLDGDYRGHVFRMKAVLAATQRHQSARSSNRGTSISTTGT